MIRRLARQRLPGRAGVDLHEDGVLGHALLAQVGEPGQPLGGAVARLVAPGDQDERRQALLPEGVGVVEATPQRPRRLAVVLGGAEHDDDVRGAALPAASWWDAVQTWPNVTAT